MAVQMAAPASQQQHCPQRFPQFPPSLMTDEPGLDSLPTCPQQRMVSQMAPWTLAGATEQGVSQMGGCPGMGSSALETALCETVTVESPRNVCLEEIVLVVLATTQHPVLQSEMKPRGLEIIRNVCNLTW